jgi:hypothetical protein
VLVLAGGARRSVPPWVRLGVHAIGIDTSKTTIRGPMLTAATRAANARIVEYLHDIGIPRVLFDTSNAVPHESTRFLERDELARFTLDTRDFGETDWRFAEKPYVAIVKGFFVRTGDAGLAYPEALLRLNCSSGNAVRLTFARERPAFTSGTGTGAHPVTITVNGTHIDVPYATQSGRIEMHTATLLPDAIAAAGDDGTIELSGFDISGGKLRAPIVLRMAGFSTAYAKLRKVCDETASVYNACSPGDTSPRCTPASMKPGPPASATAGGQAAGPAH